MLDSTLATIALRNRALGLSVCTTGSTTLSATASGYARASGSFITDGFAIGQEVLSTGFPTNGYSVIESVSASNLGIAGGRTAATSASGRTLTVGLPEGRAWDNVAFDPTPGRPYITETFIPQPAELVTTQGNGGYIEEIGLYMIQWFGLSGGDVAGIRKSVDALKARFSVGTPITVTGATVWIGVPAGNGRTRGPSTGQITRIDGGWSFVTLSVPWKARTTNAIAA